MAQVSIPKYFLDGESVQNLDERFLHVESIAQRSRLHDWHIRPHVHRALHHLAPDAPEIVALAQRFDELASTPGTLGPARSSTRPLRARAVTSLRSAWSQGPGCGGTAAVFEAFFERMGMLPLLGERLTCAR